jgi:hypothetical protein
MSGEDLVLQALPITKDVWSMKTGRWVLIVIGGGWITTAITVIQMHPFEEQRTHRIAGPQELA